MSSSTTASPSTTSSSTTPISSTSSSTTISNGEIEMTTTAPENNNPGESGGNDTNTSQQEKAVKTTTILFLRSSVIYDSLGQARTALDTIDHKQGQPIISYYYQEDNSIDCIFALGLINGSGREAYTIISSEEDILIDGVFIGNFPDITEISPGKIYLCYKEKDSGQNFWITRDDQSKYPHEITNTVPKKVKDVKTGRCWWVSSEEVKECYDFNTKEEFSNLAAIVSSNKELIHERILPNQEFFNNSINRILNEVFAESIKIKPLDSETNLYEAGEPKSLKFQVTAQYNGVEVTNECSNWKVKKEESSGDFIDVEVISDSNDESIKYIVVENLSKTEKITIRATYKDQRKKEDVDLEGTCKIFFSLKTIMGKISANSTSDINLGKDLQKYFKDWENTDVVNFINGATKDGWTLMNKNLILRSNETDFVYESDFKINDYFFIAIPNNHGYFSDIIDQNTNQSLLEDFKKIIGAKLIKDDSGNSGDYTLYLKKSGISSNGKKMSIIFKV